MTVSAEGADMGREDSLPALEDKLSLEVLNALAPCKMSPDIVPRRDGFATRRSLDTRAGRYAFGRADCLRQAANRTFFDGP